MMFDLILIVVLIAINAFLSAAEIAIISVRKPLMQVMADEGNDRARRVLRMQASPGRFIGTVQVGITIAAYLTAAVGALASPEFFSGWIDGTGIGLIDRQATGISVLVVTLVLAFITIVLGELVPKTYAVRHAEGVALRAIRPVELLEKVIHPVVVVLTSTSHVVLKLFGVSAQVRMPSVTASELMAMLETAEDEGVVGEQEANLIEDALQFGTTLVRSVMVPRVDVELLEDTATFGEAMDRFLETGHSRIPVYHGSQDHIIGILYVKDVFRVIWSDAKAANRAVAGSVRPVFHIPESKPLATLLKELRMRRTHVAVVVDEYGGMAGMVTLEDVLEELVGEIVDEFDPGYEPFQEAVPGILTVDGRVSTFDLLDRLDMNRSDYDDLDAESVGGLIAEKLGRIPEVGDAVVAGSLRFEVLEMDGYRVKIAQVEKYEPDAEQVEVTMDEEVAEQVSEG